VKDLWRKSAELLWKYPILWLPFVCSELLASLLGTFEHFVNRKIIAWTVMKHYLIQGGSIYPAKALAVSLPAYAITYFIDACIFASALVLTGSLVRIVLSHPESNLTGIRSQRILSHLALDRRRILDFALKYGLLATLMMGAIVLPLTYLVFSRGNQDPSYGNLVTAAEMIVTGLIVAWVMAPITLRLLRPANSEEVSPAARRIGRFSIMIAAAATVLLGRSLAVLFAELSINWPRAWSGPGILNMLLVRSAEPFLFIVLVLIADEVSVEKRPHSNKLRRALIELMPLHFTADKEK
jgi:hypothetical protein